ncbi:APC family permease [Brevibacterium renqingii]|uniref:APC family permease n=1 Tax=Brevibacterium renqingii TaxID=2776916 RepID=UPI001AE000BD|nr:APC family permease [Brevibacterium renqingii]
MSSTSTSPSPTSGGLSSKGLSAGKIGAIGGAVIGISCIAPAYTLTSGLGPTISEVGVHTPAVLLIGFVPMLLVVFGYRELNTAMPDSGTTFTWATRAFGPWLGWMGGWGLVAATVLVLSNLAAVAVDFLFLLLSQVFSDPQIAELTRVLWINIPVTVLLTAAAAWVSYRGVEATEKLQVWLVAFQVLALGWFVIAALVHVAGGTAFDATPVSLDWFNPLSAGDFSTVAAAVSLSIFLFWGWDTVITMNEEAKNPEKTPGRAALLTILAIVIIYIACTVAVISFAGVGSEGLGAGNPDNQESIFASLAGPVMGPFAVLVSIAVLSSSLSSLQATMVSPSRTILAMGHYGALPEKYGRISRRYKSPSVATITSAGAAIIFYVVMRLLSENALWDTITALGLMVCFYYGITGLACIWYFRRTLFTSAHTLFFRFLFPLIGGVTLLIIFFTTAIDSLDPDYGSGSSVFGIGLVFVLGIGVLLLGVVIMIVQSIRHPAFFRGQTLRQGVDAG